MPVAQLLCEGENNSPDARILSKILYGVCEVKPSGGKYGMGPKIIARRETFRQNTVFGILDGDFIKDWVTPEDKPKEWKTKDGSIHFGWRWERKEIENYLIDPIVVENALGEKAPKMDHFKTALESAKLKIATYQAARIALSTNRTRFKDIPSAFGKERGKEKHPFPDKLDQDSCLGEIAEIIVEHQKTQLVSLERVRESFEGFKKECQDGGKRNQHFLYTFSGKDLFFCMNQWFIENNLIGAWEFREKVLSGLQKTTDDIASWLKEWENLRETIKNT